MLFHSAGYGQHKYGQSLIDSLVAELPHHKDDSNKVKLLTQLSFTYYQVNPDSGIRYAEMGVGLSERLKWDAGVAMASNSLGVNYQFKSNYAGALDCYRRALKINEALGDKKGISRNVGNMGMIYDYQGDYAKALECHFKSLAINEETGNKKGKGSNYTNIGNLYLAQKDFSKAIDYYKKAAKIFEETGDSVGITGSMVLMGAYYLAQDDYVHALKCYTDVLKLYQASGNKLSAGLVLGSIAKTYRMQGDYRTALENSKLALSINTELGNKRSAAINNGEIGLCYLKLARGKKSETPIDGYQQVGNREYALQSIGHFTQAIATFKETGALDELQTYLQYLSEAYELTGDTRRALDAQKQFNLYHDSVYSATSKTKLANLEMERALELKDHDLRIRNKQLEIELLTKSNERHALVTFLTILALFLAIAIFLFRRWKEKNEAARKKSEQGEYRYKALIEHNTDAVAILSAEGKALYVSPSVFGILGFTAEEAIAINVFSHAHPDDVWSIQEVFGKAMANPGLPIKAPAVRMMHKDGNWRWADAVITNLLHDPIINGILDNFREVTEQKLAEEKILHLNRLYAFISQINEAIVRIGDEQQLFDKACSIATEFGKFELAWIGVFDKPAKKVTLIAHSQAGADEMELFRSIIYTEGGPMSRMLKSGKCHVINDYRVEPQTSDWSVFANKRGFKSSITIPIKKSGEIEYVLNLYSSIRDIFSQEELVLLEDAAEDISFALEVFAREKLRKQAEEALQLSKENLQVIMDLIPQNVFVKDREGRYLFVNKSFASLYGLEPAEVISRSILEMIPSGNDASIYLKQDEDAISSTLPQVIPESTFIDSRGAQRIFHIVKVRFKLAGTDSYAVLGVSTDITARKQAENERSKIIEDVVQRNKALEQFSYIVSHNLRSPVANIIGLSELLHITDNQPERQKMLMTELSKSVKQLDVVIQDLNYVLQVKHEVNEKRELVKFSNIARDIQMSIDSLLRSEGVQIHCDFSAVDEMMTLKSYLYSIFFNLISNSIKYHQPGISPVIDIRSLVTAEGTTELVFSDNGLGIDLKKKGDQVFGLYKRFHAHAEGKGMGLYMVRTQVETLGGKISIESEVNKGTTFRIVF